MIQNSTFSVYSLNVQRILSLNHGDYTSPDQDEKVEDFTMILEADAVIDLAQVFMCCTSIQVV